MFCVFAARGAAVDDGARLPRPTVSGGRGYRSNHEDEEDTQSQHAHRRTLQPTQVPSQGCQRHRHCCYGDVYVLILIGCSCVSAV